MIHRPLILLCALIGFASSVAADFSRIDWDDLVDQSKQVFEDPYAELEYDVLYNVVTFAKLKQQVEEKGLSGADLEQAKQDLNEQRAEFAAQDIDVDWLLDQRWVVADRRKAAAESGNPDLDGQEIELAGFAIPAPRDPDGVNVVYLVPERGMCSHMPPPNANQMLRVRLQTDWIPSMMHEPVLLKGTVDLSFTDQSIIVVDGYVAMRSSFEMIATEVVTVQDLKSGDAQGPTWMQSLADRVRPSVHGSDAETQ